VSAAGEVQRSQRAPLGDRSPAGVAAQIAAAVRALGDASLPVGVGLAGQLDAPSGVIAVSPNLGWRDVRFGELLAQTLGRPVRLVNDLNAIAVGEARAGAGRGEADVLCIFVGTGVGMGIVCGGTLWEGADGLAGELGHIKIASPQSGRLCGCGERGCLEAYAGGAHLRDLWQQKREAGSSSALTAEAVNAASLDAAAADEDAAAVALWYDVADVIARGVGIAVTLFNPRVVVLGGGVLERAPNLRALVDQAFTAYAGAPYRARLRVVASALGDDAGAVGAALLALEG
jgi:glucokinase